jgi:hypothetical protein
VPLAIQGIITAALLTAIALPVNAQPGFAYNPQHTSLSTAPAQPLNTIHWSAPIDLDPQNPGGDLFIHYGSPVITSANTVLVPVKIGAADGFEIRAFSAASGALLYSLSSAYTLPPHDWTPAYGPVLATRSANAQPSGARQRPLVARRRPGQRLYYPGPGGTLYFRDQPDSPAGPLGQLVFFGNSLYTANPAAFDKSVQISRRWLPILPAISISALP